MKELEKLDQYLKENQIATLEEFARKDPIYLFYSLTIEGFRRVYHHHGLISSIKESSSIYLMLLKYVTIEEWRDIFNQWSNLTIESCKSKTLKGHRQIIKKTIEKIIKKSETMRQSSISINNLDQIITKHRVILFDDLPIWVRLQLASKDLNKVRDYLRRKRISREIEEDRIKFLEGGYTESRDDIVRFLSENKVTERFELFEINKYLYHYLRGHHVAYSDVIQMRRSYISNKNKNINSILPLKKIADFYFKKMQKISSQSPWPSLTTINKKFGEQLVQNGRCEFVRIYVLCKLEKSLRLAWGKFFIWDEERICRFFIELKIFPSTLNCAL